jgi:DNA oxidative demethylase
MMVISQPSLFQDNSPAKPVLEVLQDGVALIHHAFDSEKLFAAIKTVIAAAPLRHMETPGGKKMSVAMTNCGDLGWTSSRAGYAYLKTDPETTAPWPTMPQLLFDTAVKLAQLAGYMGLHQDRDERDFSQPIISLSLGLPAKFIIGGLKRGDPTRSIELHDGDAIIFGGAARLLFHGVRAVKVGQHAALNDCRINLTFRVAG